MEEILVVADKLGALGVLVAVIAYLLLRERNNKKVPGNPGNSSASIKTELEGLRTDVAALFTRVNDVADTLNEIKGMLSRRNPE